MSHPGRTSGSMRSSYDQSQSQGDFNLYYTHGRRNDGLPNNDFPAHGLPSLRAFLHNESHDFPPHISGNSWSRSNYHQPLTHTHSSEQAGLYATDPFNMSDYHLRSPDESFEHRQFEIFDNNRHEAQSEQGDQFLKSRELGQNNHFELDGYLEESHLRESSPQESHIYEDYEYESQNGVEVEVNPSPSIAERSSSEGPLEDQTETDLYPSKNGSESSYHEEEEDDDPVYQSSPKKGKGKTAGNKLIATKSRGRKISQVKTSIASKRQGNYKSKTEEEPEEPMWSNLTCLQDFEEKKARLILDNPERAAAFENHPLSDYPYLPHEQTSVVKRIFNAIKNTEGVNDKKDCNGKDAQAVNMFKMNKWSNDRIWKACWDIFAACRDAVLNMIDPLDTNREGNDRFPTFSARMEIIIEDLHVSKAICKRILDPLPLHKLANAPLYELKQKISNAELNKARNVQNKIGREILTNENKNGKDAGDVDVGEVLNNYGISPDTKAKGGKRGTYLTPNIKVKEEPASSPLKLNRKRKADAEEDSGLETPPPKRSATKSLRSRAAQASSSPTPPTRLAHTRPQTRRGRLNLSNSQDPIPGAKDSCGHSQMQNGLPHSPMKSSPLRSASITDHQQMSSPSQSLNIPMSRADLNSQNQSYRFRAAFQSQPTPLLAATGGIAMEYKKCLCRLLGVDSKFATAYTLQDLRLYARAYNADYKGEDWEDPQGTLSGRGPMAQGNHLSQLIHVFSGLANARGDLNRQRNINYFQPDESEETKKALGIIDNECGIFAQIKPRES